jgi:hypothetical protein
MKLGGSLGNIPRKLKQILIFSITCFLENRLTVQNISSFYNYFCKMLTSDSPNFIKLVIYALIGIYVYVKLKIF